MADSYEHLDVTLGWYAKQFDAGLANTVKKAEAAQALVEAHLTEYEQQAAKIFQSVTAAVGKAVNAERALAAQQAMLNGLVAEGAIGQATYNRALNELSANTKAAEADAKEMAASFKLAADAYGKQIGGQNRRRQADDARQLKEETRALRLAYEQEQAAATKAAKAAAKLTAAHNAAATQRAAAASKMYNQWLIQQSVNTQKAAMAAQKLAQAQQAAAATRAAAAAKQYNQWLIQQSINTQKAAIAQATLNNNMNRAVYNNLKAQIQAATQGVNNFQRALMTTSTGMRSFGNFMTMYVTAPLMLAAGLATRAALEFEKEMIHSFATMGGVTQTQRQQMEELALTMRSAFSPIELARGYDVLAAAGLNASEAIGALPLVNKLATVGQMDLEKATSRLVGVTSALGLRSKTTAIEMANMDRVANALTVAADKGQGTIDSFSRSLGNKLAGTMRMYHMELEEGLAILMQYAKQGVVNEKAGEQATIVIRDMQRSVLKNSAAWQKLGVEVFDADGKMVHMATIIKGLEGKFAGMSDKEKRATLMMLGFQERSLNATLALLGFGKAMEADQAAITGSSKLHQKFDEIMGSNAYRLQEMKNKITAAAIEIGNKLVPHILALVETLKGWIQWFTSLQDSTQGVLLKLLMLTAVVGPMARLMAQTAYGIYTLIAAQKAYEASVAAGAVVSTKYALALGAVKLAAIAFAAVVAGIVIKALIDWASKQADMNKEIERSKSLLDGLMQMQKQASDKTLAEGQKIPDLKKREDYYKKELAMAQQNKDGLLKNYLAKEQAVRDIEARMPTSGGYLTKYLMQGELDAAKEELEEIKKLVNANTQLRKDLEAAIKDTKDKAKGEEEGPRGDPTVDLEAMRKKLEMEEHYVGYKKEERELEELIRAMEGEDGDGIHPDDWDAVAEAIEAVQNQMEELAAAEAAQKMKEDVEALTKSIQDNINLMQEEVLLGRKLTDSEKKLRELQKEGASPEDLLELELLIEEEKMWQRITDRMEEQKKIQQELLKLKYEAKAIDASQIDTIEYLEKLDESLARNRNEREPDGEGGFAGGGGGDFGAGLAASNAAGTGGEDGQEEDLAGALAGALGGQKFVVVGADFGVA